VISNFLQLNSLSNSATAEYLKRLLNLIPQKAQKAYLGKLFHFFQAKIELKTRIFLNFKALSIFYINFHSYKINSINA
jgi:hypothetical protein